MSRIYQGLRTILLSLFGTYRNLLQLRGRATRTEVWTYLIFGNAVFSLLAICLEFIVGERTIGPPTVISSVQSVLFLLPIPALLGRRLQDFSVNGWLSMVLIPIFVLAAFTENAGPRLVWIEKTISNPFAGGIILAVILFAYVIAIIPPTKGENQYGRDPRLRGRDRASAKGVMAE